MSAAKSETAAPASAFRGFIAEVAKQPLIAPVARRLRSRFSKTKFVTFPLGDVGRLGNQLFQIAATIGVARRNDCGFIFPPWAYTRQFEFPLPQSNAIRQMKRRMQQSFGYEEIAIDRATELYGYFQSERYFAHCADEVRHYFTPHHAVARLLERGFGELLAAKTCSVHVRRTDYLGAPTWFDLGGSDYYERAMAQFDADTTFVIFSDDIEWCMQRFRGHSLFFVEALSAVEDLFLMARCQAHIIANSTFSWWGAWLDANPDKKVIAPAQWFAGVYTDPAVRYRAGSGGYIYGYLDPSDMVPPGWIRL
jgi:hypothetical protein